MTNFRKLSVYLLVTTTLLVSLSLQAASLKPRIVGGSIVQGDIYPFMAALYFYSDSEDVYRFGCGGSFITSTWVVTAAHCVVDAESGAQLSASRLGVLADALDIADQDQGVFRIASNIIVHPSYDRVTSASDIALIQLPEPVNRNQSVVLLPAAGSNVPMVDEMATVAGWGATSEGGTSSTNLLQVDLPVVSHAQCLGNYPDALNSNANVCAGGLPAGGLDSCQGDSGGPLFVVRNGVYVQAGVVSYGTGCARADVPGVYTRMSSYTSWVASHVPNVLITNSGVGVFDTNENIGELQLTALNAASPIQTGALQVGTYAAYDIGNASRVVLRSQSGDADLFIFDKSRLESSQSLCRPPPEATEEPLLNESCDDISASAAGNIAIVVAARSSATFRISLSDADSDPQEDDPAFTPPLLGSSSGGGSLGVPGVLLLASLVMLRRRKPQVA